MNISVQKNNHIIALFIALIALIGGLCMPTQHAYASDLAGDEAKNNVLIVYYSRSGNTSYVAKHIQNQIGGNILQLETVDPYPSQYRATTVQAKQELEADYHPPLKTHIPNLDRYDTVFIGSPNWWGTMSMPIRTFLYENDLSGKTVIAFITHEGSGLGRTMDDLRKLAPQSTILEGIAIRGGRAERSQFEVEQWLNKIGITRK